MRKNKTVCVFPQSEIEHECKGGVCIFHREAVIPVEYVTAVINETKTVERTRIKYHYLRDSEIVILLPITEVMKRLIKALEVTEKDIERQEEELKERQDAETEWKLD